MKSTIISMFIVLVLMIAIPLILFKTDLAQQFGFGGGNGAESSDLRDSAPKNVKAVVTDQKVEVYRWKDEHGVMQFSNTPPLEGGDYEIVVLSPDTNVIDAVKIPEEKQAEEGKPEIFSVGSPYSPDGMKDMIDGSEDVKESLNQRQVDQEKILQDILNHK